MKISNLIQLCVTAGISILLTACGTNWNEGTSDFQRFSKNPVDFAKPQKNIYNKIFVSDVTSEIKRGNRKGFKRRAVELFTPELRITHETVLEPGSEIKPISKQGWGDVYFKAKALCPFNFMDIIFQEKGKRKDVLPCRTYVLNGTGASKSENTHVAVMSWRKNENSDSGADVYFKNISGTKWTAVLVKLVHAENEKTSISFLCYPYSPKAAFGTDRRRAAAISTGDFDMQNAQKYEWNLSDRLFWVVLHNTGSQQTQGAIYLFNPEDFSKMHVYGTYGAGVRAEAKAGKEFLRMAVKSFSGITWIDALEETRKEAEFVLDSISRFNLESAKFFPSEQDIEQEMIMAKLHAQVSTLGIDEQMVNNEKMEEYFKLFDIYRRKGLLADRLNHFLQLTRSIKKEQDKMTEIYFRSLTKR